MPASEQGVAKSSGRYSLIPRVLCFLTHGNDVLLLKGAPTKKIWANYYNGVGGHIERNESVRQAAIREIAEETGLQVETVELVGLVNIDTGEAQGIGMFVFRAEAPSRAVIPSVEGELTWVEVSRMLDYPLVEDLKTILPLALTCKNPFFARYFYDAQDRWQIVIDGE